MANNRVQVKRTSVAGRTPNTTNAGNLQYIAAGEFAFNMTDQLMFTSDGTNLIYVGANQVNQSITNTLSVGANVIVNTTMLFVGNSTVNADVTSSLLQIANSTSTANLTAADLKIGATTVVNSTQITATLHVGNVSGSYANITGQVNTATLYAATSANIASAVQANSTGVWTTGTVNGSVHSIGSTFIANTLGVYHTGTMNAASHTVGTAFTANSTVVNAVSYYAGTLLVANTTVVNATHLGGTLAASYVQNTDSRTLSGNLVISGTYFNPSSNTILLGNSTQRWILSANTGSFSGAVSGITTLAAGNTTLTGFINVSSTSVLTGNVAIGTTDTTTYKLNVNGSFAATTKSFVIDHPTKQDMKLRYGSLEGPENGIYIRGRANTNNIKLPDYWVNLIDENTITVNLTPIGKKQELYVKDVSISTVVVGGSRSLDYYYTVFAERKDVEKLVVEF